MTTPPLTLLVPVKDGRGAKTRLGAMGAATRAGLMAAFARDAVTAALACPSVEVVVVGDEVGLRSVLAGLEVEVVADEGRGDLNRALAAAAGRVARPGRGVAVMLADLPCLRTEDLQDALDEALARGTRAFVADAAGTGTTLLVSPAGTELGPRFGPQSARAHAASGAAALGGALSSLRLDVDTTEDLDRAVALGVGPSTSRALASLERRTAAPHTGRRRR